VTIYNDTGLIEFRNWNEYNLNTLTRNNWRASLVPAAAVIPAPIAYIKVVAVKKLVVELWAWAGGYLWFVLLRPGFWKNSGGNQDDYFEKIRVFNAGLSPRIY
jgi:hypothetical protein